MRHYWVKVRGNKVEEATTNGLEAHLEDNGLTHVLIRAYNKADAEATARAMGFKVSTLTGDEKKRITVKLPGLTADAAAALVRRLEEAKPALNGKGTSIKLDLAWKYPPLRAVWFMPKDAQQANNLYGTLTGAPLFEGQEWHKATMPRRDSPSRARGDHDKYIAATADAAMRLYGHPAHAAAVLRRQYAQLEACPELRSYDGQLTDLVMTAQELEARANGKRVYNVWVKSYYYGTRTKADNYDLDAALAEIGNPLAPCGNLAASEAQS